MIPKLYENLLGWIAGSAKELHLTKMDVRVLEACKTSSTWNEVAEKVGRSHTRVRDIGLRLARLPHWEISRLRHQLAAPGTAQQFRQRNFHYL